MSHESGHAEVLNGAKKTVYRQSDVARYFLVYKALWSVNKNSKQAVPIIQSRSASTNLASFGEVTPSNGAALLGQPEKRRICGTNAS